MIRWLTILIFLASCKTAERTTITLNGSKSYDPAGGKIIAYRWSQIGAQNAKIINPVNTVTKAELPKSGVYIFELWGKNDAGLTNKDTTIIKVIE